MGYLFCGNLRRDRILFGPIHTFASLHKQIQIVKLANEMSNTWESKLSPVKWLMEISVKIYLPQKKKIHLCTTIFKLAGF